MVNAVSQSASESYEQGRNLSLVMVLLSLLIGGGISVWIIRSVTRPLGGEPDAVKAAVERIAQGDLTKQRDCRQCGKDRPNVGEEQFGNA